MKRYLFFPGQGSQVVGMGKALYERYPEAKNRFSEASDLLSFDIAKLCFEGPEEELKKTENTQPALFIVSAIIFDTFVRSGFSSFDFAAGHSLGEYSALYAAGSIDFATAVKIVRRRGELMAKAKAGAMAAVMGFNGAAIEDLCKKVSTEDSQVVPANFNGPDQVVISGNVDAVAKASLAIKEAGAKRVLPLPVSGAFHSPLMKDAAEELKYLLAAVQFKNATVPVVSNVTASSVTNSEEIKTLLVKQLYSPVKWVDSFISMEPGLGIEMGPGKVLCGLLKKINGGINMISAHTPDEIEAALHIIGEQK